MNWFRKLYRFYYTRFVCTIHFLEKGRNEAVRKLYHEGKHRAPVCVPCGVLACMDEIEENARYDA